MKNTHAVIVSPDVVGPVYNGGIGTFVYHFARLLRQHNHRVTIVFTGRMERRPESWRARYDHTGIQFIHAYRPYEANPSPPAVGRWEFIHRGDVVREHLPTDADVVYWQDWQADGFQAARVRRYIPQSHTAFVTMLHSSSAWLREGMQQFPDDVERVLSLDFAERYTAQHSDYVASPSRYMLNWARDHGWSLPAMERCAVLGYPYLPIETLEKPLFPADRFRRLIFFGRLETRKGFDLLIETLRHVRQERRAVLNPLDEIVLLGKDGQHSHFSSENAAQLLRHELQRPVTVMKSLDSSDAQHYLRKHAADSLVVMPSLSDNFPYAVIETSLIPGLQFICSNVGGVPEILENAGADNFFVPQIEAFSEKLIATLEAGPQHQQAAYDWRKHNQLWLAFHEHVCSDSQRKSTGSRSSAALPVDICVPHRNHGRYLPELLAALDQQTNPQFNLFVVDDASTEPDSKTVFETMSAQYRHKANWHFVSNARNEGLSQTRNIAAALGQAEYILFVDADNIPLPHMVEAYTNAITLSGDDCLTCYLRAFEDGTDRTLYSFLPLGSSPELGIFMNSFGDANFIIKRSVFEALHGFATYCEEDRIIAGEDHAFLAKLTLAGYRLDVVPDVLLHYRYRSDSLFRSTGLYANTMRALRVYRQQLKPANLEHLIPLIYGLHLRSQQMGSAYSLTDSYWLSWHIPWYVLRDALLHKIQRRIFKLPIFRRLLHTDRS
jgi:glycosyltransferase involved in cell wall biosynthesis